SGPPPAGRLAVLAAGTPVWLADFFAAAAFFTTRFFGVGLFALPARGCGFGRPGMRAVKRFRLVRGKTPSVAFGPNVGVRGPAHASPGSVAKASVSGQSHRGCAL